MTDGRTHWHGCWREHHDCAVAEIERLRHAADSWRLDGETSRVARAVAEAEVERLRRLLNEARKAPLHRLAEIQMPLPPQMAEALYGDTESLYADSPSPQPRVSDYGESGAEVERLRGLVAQAADMMEAGAWRYVAAMVRKALRGEEA